MIGFWERLHEGKKCVDGKLPFQANSHGLKFRNSGEGWAQPPHICKQNARRKVT